MKNILVVQDVSCFGKCSTTVALPIISHFKLTASILPTAILSTHTGPDFPGYVMTDLSQHMQATIAHWKKLGLQFDAVYTGYLGNASHIDLLMEALPYLLKDQGLLFVDPVFADQGEFYAGFDAPYVEAQSDLIAISDYLLPNYTEACLLTGQGFSHDDPSPLAIKSLLESLQAMGTKNAIVTGIHRSQEIGAVMLGQDQKVYQSFAPYVDQIFSGTGDVFASVFVGECMQEKTLSAQAVLAQSVTFVYQAIQATLSDSDPINYGIHFEHVLNGLSSSQ